MASIRQHGCRWQARVRRNGYPEASCSFDTKQSAERWARSVEAVMDQGVYRLVKDDHQITLGDLIYRYVRDVLPSMKGQRDDAIRLTALARRWIAGYALTNLSPEHIARHRNERLRQVSPGTVVRELAYLSSIINHARKEWRFPVSNPVALVRKPNAGKGRDRVLSLEDHYLAHQQERRRPRGAVFHQGGSRAGGVIQRGRG